MKALSIIKNLLEDDENPVIDSNGTKRWYKNGLLHRLDGPAEEWSDGTKCWYQNGLLHRLDGPAIEYADGTKYWCKNHKFHRLDGPAVEHADGTVKWYINNKEYNSIEDWAKKALKLLGKPNDPISVQRYVSQIMANRIKSRLER